MAISSGPIIHFDYEFSPIAQKTKLLLTAAGIPFERVDVPALLPRKDLEDIAITYRRVPILASGKDVYCDSKVIFNVVVQKLARNEVPTSTADGAWEAWGFSTFNETLGLAPRKLMSPEFVRDRSTVYPLVARSDFSTLRPSGIADLHSRMDYLENTVLRDGQYIGGEKLSVADIHAILAVRWDLHGMESQPPGLGNGGDAVVSKDQFPKVWHLIESLPIPNAETINFDSAKQKIESPQYTSNVEGVMDGEPTGIKAGTQVTVDSLGSEPYRHLQAGKLVATSKSEIVIEVPTGLRLHFPREGQILRAA